MTILFRYILREYAKIFLMCFSGLMTIYLVIDFFEKVRRFLKFDANMVDVLAYFALKTPAISFQITPLAILMATLLTLGLLARNNEITAMRSCGISLTWIASPFLIFASFVSLILLSFSSTVIPLASEKAEQIRLVRIEKKPAPMAVKAPRPWIRIGSDSLMHVAEVEIGGATLHQVHLYHFQNGFRLDRMTEAATATYTPDGWLLTKGNQRRFHPDGSVALVEFGQQPVELSLIPDDFSTWLAGDSETMTVRDIRGYISRFKNEGSSFARLLTDYYGRLAFPFVAVIMVIVGLALSLRRSGVRGGTMAVGIGQAFVVGFCYWTTHSIAIALGRGGLLAPMLAGWIANLLFASFGLYLLLKVRY
ncbi:MAG: LPS export ABC transporter permease LptG [Nitrospira sp.]|jgi:lipopolysaccharide export system permease protein|nr:LPS export ABC transporter permease LptG [Nitrospira sp.]